MKNYYLFFLVIFLMILNRYDSFAQELKSLNEGRGNWEDCSTWQVGEDCSKMPGTVDIMQDIKVAGYVDRYGSLSFKDAKLKIESEDTLVVYGSLELEGSKELLLAGEAVLVVTGDIISTDEMKIGANGSIVVFGDFQVGSGSKINDDGGVYVFGAAEKENIAEGVDEIFTKGQLRTNDPALADFVERIKPGILPVTLLYFKVTAKNQSVEINWASAKAWDFSHYELERSENGKEFYQIAAIDAEENSNETVEYSFADYAPLVGTSYYRLKAVDIDGKSEYKGIEMVKLGAETFEVYPNPSSAGYVAVKWSHAAEGAVASLKDNTGRTVRSARLNGQQGRIETADLPAGMYLLVVQGAAGMQKMQIMIK